MYTSSIKCWRAWTNNQDEMGSAVDDVACAHVPEVNLLADEADQLLHNF